MSGRVRAFRAAGPKLLFIDLVQDGRFLQGMINIGYFFEDAKTVAYYQKFHQQLQRGDIICKFPAASASMGVVKLRYI